MSKDDIILSSNSMFYWFPVIEGLNIPVPKTKMLPVDVQFCYDIMDGKSLNINVINQIFSTADEIGYPLFLRNDLMSEKHSWEDTCYVPDKNSLLQHIGALTEGTFCHFIRESPRGFIFRELISPAGDDEAFRAFHNLPIRRERRYFIHNRRVICGHPYWIEDAIRFWRETYEEPINWKYKLRRINRETLTEYDILSKYCSLIANSSLDDLSWSVDFMHGENGWYLIDMALALESWHPEDCPKLTEIRDAHVKQTV